MFCIGESRLEAVELMPRRNHRVNDPGPSQIEVVRWIDRAEQIEAEEYHSRLRAGQSKALAVLAAQEHDRIDKRLDWVNCVVTGCTDDVFLERGSAREPKVWDSDFELPMCYHHLAVAWAMVQRHHLHPEVLTTVNELAEKNRAKREREATALRQAARRGELYVVRAGGLIKVGWSERLEERLRAYGPTAELLSHWPGSRADETDLHRTLRLALAKGREWYHEDHPLIADFIRKAVEKHGKPTVRVEWTQPKRDLSARPRRSR